MIFLRFWSRWLSRNLSGFALLFFGAALAAGIFGCATGVQEERLSQTPTASEPQRQTPSQEKGPYSQSPIKETTLEGQPFKIQELSVREERGQTTLLVKFSNPVVQYRHFPLTQPSRVVLDVFGDAKRMAQVDIFRINTNWVSTLRVSSSEGYLRLVMDITAAAVPTYVIEPDNGGLKILIGVVNPTATSKKEFQLVEGGRRTDVAVARAKPLSAEAGPLTLTRQETLKGEKKYTGQRLSLDFKDADIKNVFRLLAEVSGLNIVVTGEVQRRVTVRLVDVPWDQAMDLLIDTNDLAKEQRDNVVRISTAGKLKAEYESLRDAKRAQDSAEPLETAYFTLNYANAVKGKDDQDKELAERVKTFLGSSRGTVVADQRTNTLIIRDIKRNIDDAISFISRLDVRTPQVIIESNLIETTPSFARALGMKLDFTRSAAEINSSFPADTPASGTPFVQIFRNRVGGFSNLTAELTAAEKEGNIKIISRPSVVTLNNKESKIASLRVLRLTLPSANNTNVGTTTTPAPVAAERVNVGIELTVKPQVSSDGFVSMHIEVKSSTIADSPTVTGSAQVIPFDELSREAKADVLVRDGETIVIGGILRDTKSTSESGIPWLKDIPVMGWLFKNMTWKKNFEELMVFITPRIVGGGSENLPTAEELWRGQLKKTDGG